MRMPFDKGEVWENICLCLAFQIGKIDKRVIASLSGAQPFFLFSASCQFVVMCCV